MQHRRIRLRRAATFGPSFLTAVDIKTGKIAWQDRSFGRAQLLYADGKLIVLDEDGNSGPRDGVAAGD